MTAEASERLTPDQLLELHRGMLLIRRFDERAIELLQAGRVYGVVHPYIGQEAIAVGVCSTLRDTDRIVSNHRGHGHCIAKGADIRRMMAELFGRRDGYCHGKGGSMHIADFDIGMLGANGIVAAGLPIAAGAGLAAQLDGGDGVAVCFFGDGATGEGPFHESLNIASLWKLPVVYVCENNQYAADTPTARGLSATSVAGLAAGYNIPGVLVDGNDPLAVREAALTAVARARDGQGPSLLECRTWRQLQHAIRGPLALERRPPEQVAEWLARDPLPAFVEVLAEFGVEEPEIEGVRAWVEERLDEAVEFAEASPFPTPEEALEDVFAP